MEGSWMTKSALKWLVLAVVSVGCARTSLGKKQAEGVPAPSVAARPTAAVPPGDSGGAAGVADEQAMLREVSPPAVDDDPSGYEECETGPEIEFADEPMAPGRSVTAKFFARGEKRRILLKIAETGPGCAGNGAVYARAIGRVLRRIRTRVQAMEGEAIDIELLCDLGESGRAEVVTIIGRTLGFQAEPRNVREWVGFEGERVYEFEVYLPKTQDSPRNLPTEPPGR